MSENAEFLAGKLLVAMPGMGDPRFDHSVIFMCAHSEDGAMGLMINKPAQELSFQDLLTQLQMTQDTPANAPPIFFGGPVEHGRGFVLHTADYRIEGATMDVEGGFGMTATLDILRDIASGRGPGHALLTLGYAGWAPGQLEGEIQSNGWLVAEADQTLLFSLDAKHRWSAALEKIGIDPRLLSADGGRA